MDSMSREMSHKGKSPLKSGSDDYLFFWSKKKHHAWIDSGSFINSALFSYISVHSYIGFKAPYRFNESFFVQKEDDLS